MSHALNFVINRDNSKIDVHVQIFQDFLVEQDVDDFSSLEELAIFENYVQLLPEMNYSSREFYKMYKTDGKNAINDISNITGLPFYIENRPLLKYLDIVIYLMNNCPTNYYDLTNYSGMELENYKNRLLRRYIIHGYEFDDDLDQVKDLLWCKSEEENDIIEKQKIKPPMAIPEYMDL